MLERYIQARHRDTSDLRVSRSRDLLHAYYANTVKDRGRVAIRPIDIDSDVIIEIIEIESVIENTLNMVASHHLIGVQ
jgi:hypothetical protein